MAVVPRRGANSAYQFHRVRGSGTEQDPYEDVAVIEDGVTEPISMFLGQTLAADLTTPAMSVYNVGTLQVESPTVVPQDGNFLTFARGRRQTQIEIITVTGAGGDVYDLTLGVPIDFEYIGAGMSIVLQNCDMNVDGSGTPVDFVAGPFDSNNGVAWDLTRHLISMHHEFAGDDSKFGGIPKLTNGVYFRVENGHAKNLYNARENADFRSEGRVDYPERTFPPTGQYGTNACISYCGTDMRGIAMRLEGDQGDRFRARVRDDLTGLGYFRTKVQGHVVDL